MELARSGKRVAVVSSGDPGIYGMASLVLEMAKDIEVEIVPGIPALSFAASRVGVPVGGDFALISLSDLLVPWEKIISTLDRVALADVVIVIVNPGSQKRAHHLSKAVNVISRYRPKNTPVAIVENACQENENIRLLTLNDLEGKPFTSMNSIIFVGCSRTKLMGGRLVTDRGYFTKGIDFYEMELEADGTGEGIEHESLSFIKKPPFGARF